MSGYWDELLREARERLEEQQDSNSGLGDDMTPGEEGHFAGRWRGVGKMQTKKRGLIDVYLVWDRDGKPGFLYQSARLEQEVEAERPQVGDQVLVLRGPTDTFERDGEQRKVYPYVLRRRECGDPLPDERPARDLEGGGAASDGDIPFLWRGASDTRSAPAAAAATASA